MKTKSTSQTPRTLTRNAILLAITALALFAAPRSRAAGDCFCETIWTGMIDNNWFNQSNWSSIVPDCGQGNCPGHPVGARINTGTAQISTQAQTAHACEMFIGFNSGDSGSLSVNNGTLDQCGDIFVGYGGSGKLTITNGGFVNTFFNPSIASLAGSNGAATVDGQNQNGTKSQWTVAGELEVGGVYNGGQGGTGLLSVTNSGKVTAASVHVWKSGTLTGNSTVSTTSTSGMTAEGTISRTVGTLTIGGNLGLTFNATTQFSVTPQDLNQVDISVSGTATLDGRLSATMTGTFTAGTQFTLLHSQGVLNGTFSRGVSITYPTNQCFTPVVTTDTHNVYLNLVSCD